MSVPPGLEVFFVDLVLKGTKIRSKSTLRPLAMQRFQSQHPHQALHMTR